MSDDGRPDSVRILEALRASASPLTARQAGAAVGVSRHRARDLLNRLLERGEVGWRTDGWVALAGPAERAGPRPDRRGRR